MSYKSRIAYVIMREAEGQTAIPVAVFYDEEVAHGNAEGYNLEFHERNIEGIKFTVSVTAAYE